MLTVGLTGSTGSGKGYVSAIFKEAGIPCLDTDQVCRDVYEKGQACYADLVTYFGEEILAEDGSIDRKALFNASFPYREKYEKLNSIAFFHIMKATERWLSDRRAEGVRIAVIDAPMLYESGFDNICHKVVAVTADRETQIRRVMARDGVSEDIAIARLAKQKANVYYESRCDYRLDNSLTNEINIRADTMRLVGLLRRLSADKT